MYVIEQQKSDHRASIAKKVAKKVAKSLLISPGRSHDRSYVLFRLNGKASKGMKEFAEGGATDVLEEESQGDGGVFDEFKAPPVTKGVGKSETEFFVDGNHSLLDPLDAGSDNGFTFTSPNWPTVPQKSITRITSQSPNHPANSFFYPDRLEHPPISTVHIMKVKEYELSRVFEPTTPTRAEKAFSYKSPSESPQRTYNEVTPVINELTPPVSNELTPVSNDVLPVKDDSSAAPTCSHLFCNRKCRMRKPRDCRVSEWGEWSPCSKTCGIGEQVRERKVLKHSRRGGRPCPNLKEQKWCGSSRDCGHKYFDW
ncbi:Spondin-2 [Armadillidium vulgare]|nr:Spondin-2 [Armadillidium vulgare]